MLIAVLALAAVFAVTMPLLMVAQKRKQKTERERPKDT
jgi:hypothetical protein